MEYHVCNRNLVDKVSFIYSLSHEGKVFYIGCAIDIHLRYKQHLNANKSTTQTCLFIKGILDQNKLPELNIIDRLPYNDALLLEAKLIKYFSLAGQPLTNHQFKHQPLHVPKNIPDVVTKKLMAKIIKHRQELYIFYRTKSDTYIPFPDNPF